MKKIALILACCLVFTGCNSRNERYKGASEISDATESSSVISENSTYTSTNTENSESNSSSTSVSSNKPQSSSVLSSSSASSSKPQSSSGSSSSSASSSKPQSSSGSSSSSASSSKPQSSSSSAAAPEVIGNYGRRAPESWETEFSEEVFRLVNLERVKYGLPELKKLDSLSETASIRAWECLVEYGHNRPDGRGFETALNEQGIKWCACGENIAAGKSTPEHVVSAWMNSEGHRANILSDKYEYLGVGFYYDKDNLGGGYRYYWAQNFCALF